MSLPLPSRRSLLLTPAAIPLSLLAATPLAVNKEMLSTAVEMALPAVNRLLTSSFTRADVRMLRILYRVVVGHLLEVGTPLGLPPSPEVDWREAAGRFEALREAGVEVGMPQYLQMLGDASSRGPELLHRVAAYGGLRRLHAGMVQALGEMEQRAPVAFNGHNLYNAQFSFSPNGCCWMDFGSSYITIASFAIIEPEVVVAMGAISLGVWITSKIGGCH